MASKKLTDLVVTAAMVAARRADDSVVYLYRGAPLPSGLAEGEAKRLSDLDMVGEFATPVVAEAPRPTARINGRSRVAAAPPAATAKRVPSKSTTSKTPTSKTADGASVDSGDDDGDAGSAGDAAGDGDDSGLTGA